MKFKKLLVRLSIIFATFFGLFLISTVSLYIFDLIAFRKIFFQPLREINVFLHELEPFSEWDQIKSVVLSPQEKVEIGLCNGNRLKIIADIGVPQTEGTAPAILLLHGSAPWGRKAGLSKMLSQRFHEIGFVVLTPDATNFGGTASNEATVTEKLLSEPDYVTCCLDYLVSHPKVNPHNIFVLGHSLGAGHALASVSQDARVNSLILIGPPRFVGRDKYLASPWKRARISADRRFPDLISTEEYEHFSKLIDIKNYLHIFGKTSHIPLLLIDGENEKSKERVYLSSIADTMKGPMSYRTLTATGHYCGVFNFYGSNQIFFREDLFDRCFSEIDGFVSEHMDWSNRKNLLEL